MLRKLCFFTLFAISMAHVVIDDTPQTTYKHLSASSKSVRRFNLPIKCAPDVPCAGSHINVTGKYHRFTNKDVWKMDFNDVQIDGKSYSVWCRPEWSSKYSTVIRPTKFPIEEWVNIHGCLVEDRLNANAQVGAVIFSMAIVFTICYFVFAL